MPASDADIQAVTNFLTGLLFNIAVEKKISIGLTDLPVLGAFGRLAPADYPRVMRALVKQPGVAEFVAKYMQTRNEPPPMKDADARVRP